MDRLRWDNIARAAAVVAVIALVVAWPHLKGAPPRLPPAAAQPVSVEDPASPAAPEQPLTRPARPAPKPAPARPRPTRRRAKRQRRHVDRVKQPAPRPAPNPALPQPAPVRPRAAPPPPSAADMAAREFALP